MALGEGFGPGLSNTQGPPHDPGGATVAVLAVPGAGLATCTKNRPFP